MLNTCRDFRLSENRNKKLHNRFTTVRQTIIKKRTGYRLLLFTGQCYFRLCPAGIRNPAQENGNPQRNTSENTPLQTEYPAEHKFYLLQKSWHLFRNTCS